MEVEYMKMEERERLVKKEAIERGLREGRIQGERIGEERLASLLMNLSKQNRQEDSIKALENLEYRKKLYEEFEKGNSNISSIIDNLTEEEQNHVTAILAEDFEIENTEKAIDDLLKNYEKDKLQERKQEIMELRKQTLGKEEQENLLNELNEIIYKLAKIK